MLSSRTTMTMTAPISHPRRPSDRRRTSAGGTRIGEDAIAHHTQCPDGRRARSRPAVKFLCERLNRALLLRDEQAAATRMRGRMGLTRWKRLTLDRRLERVVVAIRT